VERCLACEAVVSNGTCLGTLFRCLRYVSCCLRTRTGAVLCHTTCPNLGLASICTR
jgi:hypothetical protein